MRSLSESRPLVEVFLLTLALFPDSMMATGLKARDDADPPCSATSHSTGTFVDLRALERKGTEHDFVARMYDYGYDYGTNFTLNICAPTLSSTGLDFHALPSSHNVSAYYRKDGKVYSMGQASSYPVFRGRKLVLEYTGGSLCPKINADGVPINGTDNDEGYRKTTTLSFTCDRELTGQPAIGLVSVANECSYFIDVRTPHACATIKQAQLAPVSIFGIIFLVALLVYFIGGCFYQRTVLHARGWRQIPHWQTWLGALNFFWDMIRIAMFSVINLFSRICGRGRSSGRFGGGGSGYTAAPVGDGQASGGRGGNNSGGSRRGGEWSDVDDENRLIDQLDDEWSDG